MKIKLKVLILIGTRPELIKLSILIKKMSEYFQVNILYTGQNYDKNLSTIFIQDLEIKNKINFLNLKFSSSGDFIGKCILKVDKYLAKKDFDALIILGDTNSCLAAIAAKKRKVPIFHIEAGNRCFEQRVPEETNRKVLDHLSDINFVYSSIARHYLLNENIDPRTIIKVGSPMLEIYKEFADKINNSIILKKLNLKKYQYILISSHREENVDNKNHLKEILKTIKLLYKKFRNPIVYSVHPRTEQKLKDLGLTKSKNKSIIFSKPFCFTDYSNLCMNSKFVLSDSGTLTEEASILNFKAINLREEHERPEGLEEGSVIASGINSENILRISDYFYKTYETKPEIKVVNDYNITNFSEKIIRNILGNLRFINHRLYKKN